MVILRSAATGMASRDVFLGPFPTMASAGSFALEAASAAAAGAAVEVEEVERRHIPILTRDAGVLAVAPAMPMRLIEPRVDQPSVVAAAPVAWGVRAVGADASPFTGDGIVVAVLDTGIDAAHAAFQHVTLVQRDFTGSGDGDAHGHGTHCAGTIFGGPVGGTRIGVAPGVRRALIGKVLGGSTGGSSGEVASAVLWAVEQGAHVVSMSLGIDFPGYVAQLEQTGLRTEPAVSLALEAYRTTVQLFDRLAALVQARGALGQATVLVAAAGNESGRDQQPSYEIGVSPPAVAPGFISVAALEQAAQGLTVADFSNTGANVAAPGVGIVSAARGGGLAQMSGTSMATPHVAGVAALWAERILRDVPLTPAVLATRLVASASRAGLVPGVDPFDVGEGLVQAPPG